MSITVGIALVVVWLVATIFFKTVKMAIRLFLLFAVVGAVWWFMRGGSPLSP